MPEPQLGDLRKVGRERVDADRANRLELFVRRPGRTLEIRLSAFASRFASARIEASTACSSSSSAVSPAPASARTSEIVSWPFA